MASRRTRWLVRIGAGLVVVMSLGFGVGAMAMRNPQVPARGPVAAPSALEPQMVSIGAQGSGSVSGASHLTFAGVPMSQQAAGSSTDGSASTLDDRVVRDDEITLEVPTKGFESVWSSVYRLVTKFGGYVLSADRSSAPVSQGASAKQLPTSGDITLRVPASRFEAAADALRALGVVRGDAVSSQDVSQEYVDLRSRLRNSRATEAALLRLMARARTVGETLAVQNRLSSVEGEIEQTTGRMKYLDAHTRYGTITMHIAEPGTSALAAIAPSGPTLAKAWHTAMSGLVRIGGALLIFAVWGGPFLLAGFGLLVAWRRARRLVPEPGEAVA